MKNGLVKRVAGIGGHYSIYRAQESMELLKSVFPDATANEMNLCLFSTSGVHGTYQTIEDAENEHGSGITFLIIHPRLVSMQYGVVYPKNNDDFEFLKKLRKSSKNIVERIGS